MATVIRMQRGGRTHAPYYRVVVMDSRNRTRGSIVEQSIAYHPCARREPTSEIDSEKALAWLSKGAQPSEAVRAVLTKKGLMKQAADAKKS